MRIVYGSLLCFSVLLTSLSFALTEALPIPRTKTFQFLSEGTFNGGSYGAANLERIRFSAHVKEGYERWVIDFSDPTSRLTGKIAPRFQIRYIKPPKVENVSPSAEPLIPPKFILTFQKIERNFLEREKLKALVRKSRFLKDIFIYPAIENGDLALEIILKDGVLFEAHQPKEQEGRLVLDVKNAPL